MMDGFHFLRPWAFLALVLLPLLLAGVRRRRLAGSSWRKVVDPALLPHLLQGPVTDKERRLHPAVISLLFCILVTALAGPAWRKIEQPLFRTEAALVVVLDLSRSMDTADIKPTRLERVKLKLLDILKERKDGQTGLVVFSAAPYVMSPLTPDSATISLQIKSLATDLMPSRGSRPDRALAKAAELIRQAGAPRAEILLVTDGLGGRGAEALAQAAAGHRLSVLGVGTPEGGPVPAPGQGFVKDKDGAIVLAGLEEPLLEQLAGAGGGRYHRLSSDDRDIDYLLAPIQGPLSESGEEALQGSDQWQEEGPWLVLFSLPVIALFFRRGILVLVGFLLFTLPGPAEAVEWEDLWLRRDQQGARALAAERPEEAAGLFDDPEWRAAAGYQAGNYEQSLQALEKFDSSRAHYNRGNSLARLGRYQEALDAYDEALKQEPGHQDALYNRELVQQALEQQQQQEQNQDQQQGQEGSGEEQESQSGNQGKQEQQDNGSRPDGRDAAQNPAPTEENSAADEPGDRTGEPEGNQPPENKEPQPAEAEVEAEDRRQVAPDKEEQTRAAGLQHQETESRDQAEEELRRWLRGIPDDPGGLWRRKFRHQYQQQYKDQREEEQAW